MSLIAIWGVLWGRTWVEVMWLVAPDGECVGTGNPRLVSRGDDQRGEPVLAFPVGKPRQTSGAFPIVRTPERHGPPGSAPRSRFPACHDRRAMDDSPPPP